ncbi:MAG: hypothetical protein ABJC87_07595 [Roseobacter sp.]
MTKAAQADPPQTGLIWNKTGLPAVFPLQIKTPKGQDYLMTLVDHETKMPALSAFIVGGAFFKVLVPPGVFKVHFAQGENWQNDEDLFGAGKTLHFTLENTLRFAVLDVGTKGGHVIDMTKGASEIAIKGQYICQRVAVSQFPRLQEEFNNEESFATRLTDSGEILRFPHRFSSDRLSAGVISPIISTDFAPYFSDPRFEVRTTPC